jgi:UDP-glucose 4-epimerase
MRGGPVQRGSPPRRGRAVDAPASSLSPERLRDTAGRPPILGGASTSDRILVTGSAGVVGRALSKVVRSAGYEVVGFDLRDAEGRTTSNEPAHDVRDLAAIRKVTDELVGVIHLAAISRGAPAEADPALAGAVNVRGTWNVLEALRTANSPAWFILASSREVYGEPEVLPVGENHPTRPKGVYGRTKLEAERAVLAQCESSPRPFAILRFTNLYGDANDYPERVIPAFVQGALEGKPLEVRGPSNVLDFLHLRDAVSAIAATASRLSSGDPVPSPLNITSGEGITLADLAETIIQLTRSSSPVRTTQPVSWTPSGFVGDSAKAREFLGWHPTVSFDSGLRTLISERSRMPL